jgi:2-polyprenyl-3-methyl-5-hydroxy-6-metoxy-1,4-benzoquinol methylase
VTAWRLFEEGTVPPWTTAEWYAGRDRAPHVDEAVHKDRLLLAARMVDDAARDRGFPTLVDLGCGDGGLLWLLAQSLVPLDRAWGYDLQQSNVAPGVKERHVDVRYGDVVNGEIEWGEIAVATEMLEHLVDPHAFVRRIAEHSRVLVASSPHTERPGNAYEFHTWAFDLEGYHELLEQAGYEVVAHETTGMFQVITGVRG